MSPRMTRLPLRSRWPASRASAVALAALLGACFSEEPDTSAPDGDDDVVIIEMTRQQTFEPRHVNVQVGQTIRWVNVSNVPHTSTADPDLAGNPASVELPNGAQPWNSGNIAPGGSYDLVLEEPGDYSYFCIPHEFGGMIGTVTVSP